MTNRTRNALLLAGAALAIASQAWGHEATNAAGQPLGWSYPWACCSGQDCAPIPASSVHETPDGYRVVLMKGDHPFATSDTPLVYEIPYNDKRIKDSGFVHRLNLTYKPNDDLLFYGTWSRGFRPGGVNRRRGPRNWTFVRGRRRTLSASSGGAWETGTHGSD